MPNMTPAEWDDSAAQARAQAKVSPWPGCAHDACVDVARVGDGVDLTSTLGPDKGKVHYNDAEWTTFIADVKAGAWDHTLAPAMANVA